MALYVMNQLAQFGEVRRGTLGVYVQDLTPELAGAFGVQGNKGALVAEVAEGSAADKAGVRAGDVITRLGDFPVINAQSFHNLEGQLPLGETLTLHFVRERQSKQARLTVEAPRFVEGEDIDRRLSGARFEELPLKLRSERIRGVLISDIEPDSRLARQGFRKGDIITGVSRRPVATLSEFQTEVQRTRGAFVLQILRNGESYIARID
jgi:serine protease Do/serine protease DegQ